MRFFLLSLLLWTGVACAQWSTWDDKDKALLVASTGLLATDWLQTREIVEGRHSAFSFYETNPILGRHPSLSKVNWYFGSMMLGNYLIADWLGPDKRWIFLGYMTAIELRAVRGNYMLGVRVGF